MITLEKIDNIVFDWNKNGILYAGDFGALCEAARRGVEADGELNATKHILEDYKKAHSQAAKWQQHYLERAEKAEAGFPGYEANNYWGVTQALQHVRSGKLKAARKEAK